METEWSDDVDESLPDDDLNLPREAEPDDEEPQALLGDDDDPGGLDQMLQEERGRGAPAWVFDDISKVLATTEIDLTVRLRVPPDAQRDEAKVDAARLRLLDEEKYLGALFTDHGPPTAEVTARINESQYAYAQLHRAWRHGGLQQATKVLLFEVLCMAVLLYGLPVRLLSAGALRRLERGQNRCLRRILRMPSCYEDSSSNRMIRCRVKTNTVDSKLRRPRLGFLQRVLRGGRDTAAARSVLFGSVPRDAGDKDTSRLLQLERDVALLLHNDQHILRKSSGELSEQPQLGALAKASKKMLDCVLSVYSPDSPVSARVSAPGVAPVGEGDCVLPCPECGKRFKINRARVRHRTSAHSKHKKHHPERCLVLDGKCPACSTEFRCQADAESQFLARACAASRIASWKEKLAEARESSSSSRRGLRTPSQSRPHSCPAAREGVAVGVSGGNECWTSYCSRLGHSHANREAIQANCHPSALWLHPTRDGSRIDSGSTSVNSYGFHNFFFAWLVTFLQLSNDTASCSLRT